MTTRFATGAAGAPLFQTLEVSLRQAYPELAGPTPLALDSSAVDSSDAQIQVRVNEIRRKTAVVAWFNPTPWVDAKDRAQKERILSALVAECDVRASRDRARWCLRREVRQRVLSELAADAAVMTRVLRETAAQATDDDARLLRRVLQGDRIDPARLSSKERLSLLRVAEWTEDIFDNAPAAQDIRGLVARDAIKESLHVLVERFRGRKRELRLLRRFISNDAPVLSPLQGVNAPGDTQLPVLGVSGIGGVGKSALLSRFADGLLGKREASRAAVVLIDFDRARFSSGDPVALTFEVTRQLGAWFPAMAESLRNVRRGARVNYLSSEFASRSRSRASSEEGTERSASELLSRLPRVLRNGGIGTRSRPLIIVLDTLEVLQAARSDDIASAGTRGPKAVADWLINLLLIGGLHTRVIVAGRAPIKEDLTFGPMLTEPELRLLGLDRASATALLRDEGIRRRDADRLLEALADGVTDTYNPLIVRLAARLVQTGTVRPELLMRDVPRGRKALDQELVQGMLYRRILAHIGRQKGNEMLAELAHPGLVLRRVTADVIERVLLSVIAPKKRGKVDSTELFNRLRREVWLVREVDKDTVEHRADLRRTMLRLIDVAERAEARKIHRAAIKYYREGLGVTLAPDAAGEAFYHTLMLMTRAQAAKLTAANVRQHESSLLPNMEDLPPYVRTVVKSLIDKPLTDKEGLSLPEPRRSEFIYLQGERHLLNDEPERALKLLEATNQHPLTNQHPWWELQALATLGEWEKARERRLLGPSEKVDVRSPTSSAVYDQINLISWTCLCLGDTKAAYEHESGLLRMIGPVDLPSLDSPALEAFARGLTYRTLAARAAELGNATSASIPWSRLRDEQLGATSMALEATRHAILSAGEPASDCLLVFSGEALPPSEVLLGTLRSVKSPELKRRLARVRKQLEMLPRRASSGEILGTVARAFPKALAITPALWPDMNEDWQLVCPNPEFRGPVKYALLEAFKTERELTILGEIGASLMGRPPSDLEPTVFAKTARRRHNPGPEIAKLVLFIDRLGVLGTFLRMARRDKPKAVKLARVADAFERWSKAFMPTGKPAATRGGRPPSDRSRPRGAPARGTRRSPRLAARRSRR